MKIKILSILALLVTMTQGAWATGELTGVFSVSASKKVCFSKGNLQLDGANTWKFAANQWDSFGDTQANNHRDLFGWGTGNNPNQISKNTDDYLSPTDWGENTYLQATLGAGWHTLTQPEWKYLFDTRSASTVAGTTNARYAKAQVNGRHGVILFPDIYTHPAGVANPVGINNEGSTGWDGNSYSTADWAKMEAAGCVFLPVTGYRNGETVDLVDTRCSYWTYTSASSVTAYCIYFYGSNQSLDNQTNCYQGYAVRLVKEITYNVTRDATMSEGWTIDPAGPVAAGAAVTATYSGSKHVKSVRYIPKGYLDGKFSIGDGRQVYFSKGNLQLVDENSWKFADNQWETFGENQSDNHRDLFGWCTVATPNKTSDNYEDYTSDTDWGYDPYLQACIGTGWHLITGGNYGEWNYLLNSRTTTSDIRYAVGSVNGKNGLILLPDDWNAEYYALNNTNKVNGPYGDNVISLSDWTEKLEAHGAVFLPAGGHRIGTKLYVVNDIGHYWCSTRQANGDVMRIDEDLILPNWALDFYYGCSIRLVRDVAE